MPWSAALRGGNGRLAGEAFVLGKASGPQRQGKDGLQARETAAQEGREVPEKRAIPWEKKEMKIGDPALNWHQ